MNITDTGIVIFADHNGAAADHRIPADEYAGIGAAFAFLRPESRALLRLYPKTDVDAQLGEWR
jgi:hypothetical protein